MASSVPSGLVPDLRHHAEVRLAPLLARVVQAGWLLLQAGAIALAAAVSSALHQHYQSTCPDQICDLLPHANRGSVQHLDRLGISMRDYATAMVTLEWGFMLLATAVAAVIVWKKPRDPVALLLAYFLVVVGASTFLRILPGAYPDFILPSQISAFLLLALALPIFARFPDGRWVPRWSIWVAIVVVPLAAMTGFSSRPLTGALAEVEFGLSIAVWGFVLGAQIYRYRRVSSTIHRQQSKWLLFAMAMVVLNVLFVVVAYVLGLLHSYQFLVLALCYGATSAILIAIGFAVLRYRLFDIDVVINRALVYGGLTAIVIGVYALFVGLVGHLLQVGHNIVLSIIATGVVAVLFQPARERLQRSVNRFLYGERDDPYAVISQLSRRLEGTMLPDTVFATIVETVATALKFPYASIVVPRNEKEFIAARYGECDSRPLIRLPLTYQGDRIGEMQLVPRPGEEHLSRVDADLLEDLARQVGTAVHATQLTRDLQRAREQLLITREEERRRLRRDLHDGLGPALASQALTLDTVELLLENDPKQAAMLLRQAKEQSQQAVAEIRRVVYQLRPPALDDLGLVGAVRESAMSYTEAGVAITVDAPEPFPPLPAAVEVAAYRILQESLINVARHAAPCRCRVSLSVSEALRIEIVDDGLGFSERRRTGVGLFSMRERAEELGGTFDVDSRSGEGTRITATLPLER